MIKKLLISLFLFPICGILFSENTITETFESGLPTSTPGSETAYTLSTGTWKLMGAFGKSDNGSLRLAMNTNGYAVSMPIDKPTNLSFKHRGSGSGKILTVQKSIDNGANWATIGTATVNSASVYGSSNMSIGEPGTNRVLLKFICGSATIYVDDVTITTSNIGDEPTTQASLFATEVNGSSMRINFTKGNGVGRLLIYSKDNAPSWIPTDGTEYLNLPKAVDDNVIAVTAGDLSNVLVTGLEAGAVYHFAVFEYNGTGDGTNYLTSTVGRLEQPTSEVPSISVNSSGINFGSVKTGTDSKRSFTLSAKYLNPAEGNVALTSSENFLISVNSASGFTTSLNLPYLAGNLDVTTIYVQFLPTELKSYSTVLSISGGKATGEITLTGTGSNTDSKVYYLSPTGNDSGEGTYDSPWYNLQKAVDAVVPGDTILVRGGTYYPNMMKDGTKTTIRLNATGSADKGFTIQNYPNEFPILNFKDQPKKVSVRGIQLNGNYWKIKGLHITQAGDNGLKIEGNYNVIEKCTFSYNDDTGLQLGFGHNFSDSHPGISSNDGNYCAYNDIIDCDSYLNCDADNFGSDADGFACKMHNGKGNRFIRCRAWDNADDAWDLYETDYAVNLIECWGWGSGRASNFGWVLASGSFQGNGNGIKLGGNGTGGSSKGTHEVWNCVAFNNNKTGSVKGFDQNSHGDGVKLVNNLAFGNGYDFMFEKSGNKCEYYNNVCFGNIEIASGGIEDTNAMLSTSSKAWKNNIIRGFSMSDYESLSEEDAKAPRGTDGSMPKKFARLKNGSVLVNSGLPYHIAATDEFPFLAQPIYGSKRDLGPYELQEGEILSGMQVVLTHNSKMDISVGPNPCKTEAIIRFSLESANQVSLKICNVNGQIIKEFYNGKADTNVDYYIPVSVGELNNGIYLCVLSAGNQVKTAKLSVSK